VAPNAKYNDKKKHMVRKRRKLRQLKFGPMDHINDLRIFTETIVLPSTMAGMDKDRAYAIVLDYAKYPESECILLTCWKMVSWLLCGWAVVRVVVTVAAEDGRLQ
jgi:hypothetical protein